MNSLIISYCNQLICTSWCYVNISKIREDYPPKEIIVFPLFFPLVRNRKSLFSFYTVLRRPWRAREKEENSVDKVPVPRKHSRAGTSRPCARQQLEAVTVLQITCRKTSQRARCQLHDADKSTVEVTIWKGKISTSDNIWGSCYISRFDCCSKRQMQFTLLSYHRFLMKSGNQNWHEILTARNLPIIY